MFDGANLGTITVNQGTTLEAGVDCNSMDYVDLGKRVRARRTALNWTQEHLAQEIGVSTSFIGHIERGSRKASIDTLVMLANAMQISTDELLGGSLSMPNDLVMPVKNLTKGQKQAMMQILTTAQEQVLQWNTPDE